MPRREIDFADDDKIRTLLWCARHCCLCGKVAGVGIEVAHIPLPPDEKGKASDIDNAIPLCFDCHAAIGHYNAKHPRGKNYSAKELRARRNQVYEQHTRHLVPPVLYRLTQVRGSYQAKLPEVLFEISNQGITYPVRAKVEIELAVGEAKSARNLGPPITEGHYNGRYWWNLNPQQRVNGRFMVPPPVPELALQEAVRARAKITLRDIYEFDHMLLTTGYILNPGRKDWYFEPAEDELGPASSNAYYGSD